MWKKLIKLLLIVDFWNLNIDMINLIIFYALVITLMVKLFYNDLFHKFIISSCEHYHYSLTPLITLPHILYSITRFHPVILLTYYSTPLLFYSMPSFITINSSSSSPNPSKMPNPPPSWLLPIISQCNP